MLYLCYSSSHAMSTADSVFLKDELTGENVSVTSSLPPSSCTPSECSGCMAEPLLLMAVAGVFVNLVLMATNLSPDKEVYFRYGMVWCGVAWGWWAGC